MGPNPPADDVMPVRLDLPQNYGSHPEQFGVVQIALTIRGRGSLTGGIACDRNIAVDRAGLLSARTKFTLWEGRPRSSVRKGTVECVSRALS